MITFSKFLFCIICTYKPQLRTYLVVLQEFINFSVANIVSIRVEGLFHPQVSFILRQPEVPLLGIRGDVELEYQILDNT